jgi:HTH-type transcriptional regulator/antitoxin HigA
MMDNNKTIFLIHPGKSLEEALAFINMSQLELSGRTGIAPKTINEIIKGKNPITPETALKFEKVLDIEASFWNNLQKNYDELVERNKERALMLKQVEIVKKYSCYPNLVKLGYVKALLKTNLIEKGIEKLSNLYRFYSVSSLSQVPNINGIVFRKSAGEYSKENLAAWLRCAEIDAEKINAPEYNEELLKSNLAYFRSLTLLPQDFSKKIKEKCLECGVIVVFTPYFPKTKVNGSFRWFRNKPLLQLNNKGAYSDIFWFTFFHELGHLFKHGKKDEFIEFDKNKDENKKENEANEFALNILYPDDKYEDIIKSTKHISERDIKKLTDELKIDSGIVAGRLAKEGLISWAECTKYRKTLKFISN